MLVNGDVWTDYDFARLPDELAAMRTWCWSIARPRHPRRFRAGRRRFGRADGEQRIVPGIGTLTDRALFDDRRDRPGTGDGRQQAEIPLRRHRVYRPSLFDDWRNVIAARLANGETRRSFGSRRRLRGWRAAPCTRAVHAGSGHRNCRPPGNGWQLDARARCKDGLVPCRRTLKLRPLAACLSIAFAAAVPSQRRCHPRRRSRSEAISRISIGKVDRISGISRFIGATVPAEFLALFIGLSSRWRGMSVIGDDNLVATEPEPARRCPGRYSALPDQSPGAFRQPSSDPGAPLRARSRSTGLAAGPSEDRVDRTVESDLGRLGEGWFEDRCRESRSLLRSG